MNLSLFCFNFTAKYRISANLRKSRWSNLYSSHSNSSILRHYYQRFSPTVCNSSSFSVGFHSSVILNAKTFQEKENEYAHSIMENLPSYSNSIVQNPLPKVFIPMSNSPNLVKDFIDISCQAQKLNLNLEDTKFIPLITNLTNKMPTLSDEDIIETLHHLCLWPPTPKSYSPNYKRIWNTLDFQCTQRLKTWDLNRKLIVADYLFHLRLNRISQYNRNLILNLFENLHALSDHQIVQLMFFINLQRHVPQSNMHILENKLLSVIKTLSLEEIGIICLGFFKTESRIHNFNTIELIIEQLLSKMDKTYTLTVAAVLKFLKKSMNLSCTESYIPVLHKCVSCIPNFDIPTTIHAALLASECHVYHPLLLDTVTEKIADCIESARVKDCTKLMQCLSHFNYLSKSKFHELYSKELKKNSRKEEIDRFPRVLIYTVLFYAYLGHFDYEVISTVLDPNFVQNCIIKCPETRNAFSEIDYCVDVECKDYKGPRLHKNELKWLGNRRGNMPNHSDNQNIQTRIMCEIVQTLEDLMNSKRNILIRHILPHFFSPDIIVRLSGGSKSMSDLYGSLPPEYILVPPEEEVWACFVVAAPFAFAFKSKHVTGVTAMKLRQLGKLNYKTVLIPFNEIPMTNEHQKRYVKGKLDALQKDCNNKMSMKL